MEGASPARKYCCIDPARLEKSSPPGGPAGPGAGGRPEMGAGRPLAFSVGKQKVCPVTDRLLGCWPGDDVCWAEIAVVACLD